MREIELGEDGFLCWGREIAKANCWMRKEAPEVGVALAVMENVSNVEIYSFQL